MASRLLNTLTFTLLLVVAPLGAASGEVVVLVNESNGVESLSLRDLARIYKFSRTRWENGTGITPILPPSGSEASRALVKSVFNLDSEAAIARFYLRAIYRQRIARPPERCSGPADAANRVFADPGAIAIIDRGDGVERSGVRILVVEGL